MGKDKDKGKGGNAADSGVFTSSSNALTPVSLESEFVVKYDDLEVKGEIGRGSYGIVCEGRLHGSPVAIKRLQMPERLQADFNAEVALLKRLRHPNIILFLGATVPPDPLCIVIELAEKGTLEHIIAAESEEIGRARRVHYATEIARGMNYLHYAGIIHHDLKPTNVLVSAADVCKVSDFGLSKIINFNATSVTNRGGPGTIVYTAPEVFRGDRISAKADVYSFAICLWELFTRQVPFKGLHVHAICFAVVATHKRPEIDEDWEEDYAQLVREFGIRSRAPARRSTPSSVVLRECSLRWSLCAQPPASAWCTSKRPSTPHDTLLMTPACGQ
eukprot:Opistho-2@62373